MGLAYHFGITAPAAVRAGELEAFLQDVEGDARLMGFSPTAVVNGPFDTAERRQFAKRVARGLVVEHDSLIGADLPTETCWNLGKQSGCCRLAPDHGVLLVVTDTAGRETVFGFFRYPRVIRDRSGREILQVPGDGGWTSGNFVCSPDPRYRSIMRRFAAAGYLASELDEFVPVAQR